MGTSDRRPYETATVLDQDLLDQCQDNLVQRIEMIVDVYGPTETYHWSDRAKFVGTTFYANRVTFPQIDRTVGDFLSTALEFSDITLVINNTDREFSNVLPGGADYAGWINRRVEMKIGLAELTASYVTVFDGFVTHVGGFSRDTKTFTLTCRNKFDSVNVLLPNQTLITDDFPDLEDDFVGLGVPVIYGQWNTSIRVEKIGGVNTEVSAVPAFPVNGLDPLVNASLDPPDPSAGDTELRCVISSTPLRALDTSSVTLRRGDSFYVFDPGDIAIVGGSDNTIFDITQKNLMIDGSPWIYETGDEFYVKCDGVDLSGFDENMVWIARDILIRFGGISSGDFDSTWATYRDKASPSQSAVANIGARVWFQESARAIELANSLLEQVRLETFINRDNKWSICSLHFDDFDSAPTFKLRNWDIGLETFNPRIDERNNFNRAKADFDFNPASGQNRLNTELYENTAAISQAGGKVIGKLLTYPNLYTLSDVENQLKEVLRLVSGYTELPECTLTSRSFLRDLCDFVQLAVDIGSVEFSSAGQPIVAMIRSLTYQPETMGISAKLWLYQMINFPGYTGPTGTVGGYDKAITKVT